MILCRSIIHKIKIYTYRFAHLLKQIILFSEVFLILVHVKEYHGDFLTPEKRENKLLSFNASRGFTVLKNEI